MKKIFFFFLFCLGMGQIVPAVNSRVTLNAMYDITQTSASADIMIQSDSSTTITFTYGVCYSTSNTIPTTSDSKASGSSGTGVGSPNSPVKRTVSISGLTANTTYYIRAYATSTVLGKTFYGQVSTLTTPPNENRALNFDGSNDYVGIPDNSLLDLTTNYTITAWVKPETFSYLAGIVSKYQTTATPSYTLRLSDNSPYSGFDFDEKITSTGILTAGTWYHVAAVKSGSTRTLYLNGIAYSLSGTALTPVANADSLRIGLDYNDGNPGRYFDGAIDEVSIWSKALTQSEITSGMNNGFTGKETGLVAYYKFDQGTASGTNTGISTLADASSNNQTGYLKNFTRTGSSSNFVSSFYLGSTTINSYVSTAIVNCTYKTVYYSGGSYTVPEIKTTNYFSMETDHTASSSESHSYNYGACWSTTNSTPTMSSCDGRDESGYGGLDGDDSYTGYGYAYIDPATPGTTYYIRPVYCIDKSGFTGNSESDYHYGDVIAVTYPVVPTVTTSAVTNVSTNTATGNGNITNLGYPASIITYGICWSSTNATPTVSDSKVSNGTKTTTGAFTSSITGLTPGTTYYVRAYATNSTGTAYGSVVSFTAVGPPTVSTSAATSITTTTATANGNIASLGNPASVTAYGFCWSSTNTIPTLADSVIAKGSTTSLGSFTGSLTGLTKGGTYYIRAYATNSYGTSYGSAVSFTTQSEPVVTTEVSTGLGITTATINGNITYVGYPASVTAYGFCWSSTNTTPSFSDVVINKGSTTTAGAFSTSLSGLTQGHTYYVRAYAINAIDTAYGGVISFTTLTLPSINTTGIDTISNTNVIAKGSITSLGDPSNLTAYGFCWSNTNTLPTLADNMITLGSRTLTGAFSHIITGLTPNTHYYLRAYATNAGGTSYGDTVSFATVAQSFTYTIRNDVQTSDKTLEFDLYLLNTNSNVPIEIASVQTGVTINPNIINGGTISVSFVADSSSMNSAQVPTAKTFASNCIKIAAKSATCGNGTVMSVTPFGTRVCRIKLTNTVAFAKAQPNLAFNFTTSPYATKLSYHPSSCSGSTVLVTNSINCYSLATNSILNVAPTLTTDSVVNITSSTAAGHGTINSLGSTSILKHGFVYSSINTQPTLSDSSENLGSASSIGSFTATISGLKGNRTYYVRTFAINSVDTVYGNVVSFTALQAPTVSTQAVSSMTTVSGTANGTIVSLGKPESLLDYGFCWDATNAQPTISNSKLSEGTSSATGTFSGTISGLSAGTTYYLRAYAINAAGTTYGNVVSFTTTGIVPTSISYTTPDTFFIGAAITQLSPTSVGGTAITHYSISPALPAGLSIDTVTGIISGTPMVISNSANYTITGTNTGGSVTTVVNITVVNTIKELSLKAYLQGFWNSTNMNQCKDGEGNAIFPSATDTLSVVLYSSSSPSSIVYQLNGLYIEPDGTIHASGMSNINIPATYSGSYYITIKTRNHIKTTSASAVSFAGSSISYDFTTAANKAYGSNMIAVSGGYALYIGDVNQDGVINSTDVSLINDQIDNFVSGYMPEDTNGDGIMDSSDIDLIESNVNNLVSIIVP